MDDFLNLLEFDPESWNAAAVAFNCSLSFLLGIFIACYWHMA